jgi:hypothetical protein
VDVIRVRQANAPFTGNRVGTLLQLPKRAIHSFVLNDILNCLDNLAVPRRDDGGQDRRHTEGFRGLRQATMLLKIIVGSWLSRFAN